MASKPKRSAVRRRFCPRLEWLEGRLQPGSMHLTTPDLDWMGNAVLRCDLELLALPSAQLLSSLEHNIDSLTAETDHYAKQVPAYEITAQTGSARDMRDSKPGADDDTVSPMQLMPSPAFHMPRAAVAAAQQASAVAESASRPTGSPLPQHRSVRSQQLHASIHAIDLELRPSALRFERRDCDGGATKAPLYNSYRGAASNDANHAVAAGKGPNLGKAYTVGHSSFGGGSAGTVDSYLPNGACEFGVTISGGIGIEIRDIAVNTNGIYVAGTDGGGSGGAFIIQMDSTLTPIGLVTYAAPAGGFLALNGIGLSSNPGSPDVYVTGIIFDPNIHAHPVGLAHSFDPTLAVPRYSTTFDYGGVTEGLSIDADRGRHAYIGSRFQGPGGVFNVTLRINSGGLVSPWSTSFVSAGHPDEGMHGVRLLGGSSSAGGLYAAGLVVDPSIPGLEALMLAKLDPATGSTAGPNRYAVVWSQPGINWSGWDIAVDRSGNAYVADRIGYFADFDAGINKFDPSGGIRLGFTVLGAPGFDDRSAGIDLETSAATANVFMVGTTTTPTASMIPPPSGCDPTWNGGDDGFVTAASQPL